MIRRLPDDVIARISAGEVITRPYNILKEIIENSLDANCTRIIIRICSSGLSLEVEDDGDGILKDDFQLLCKQYCTSKLINESDMFSLSSYGFRGEALSSISRCSKIKVKSRRREDEIGYEAIYSDTELVNIKGVGMNGGTWIEIKDIFYNNKIREKYFTKRREEMKEMIDLVESYSVLRDDISFELVVGGKIHESCSKSCTDDESKIKLKIKMLDGMYNTGGELFHDVDDEFLVIFSNANCNLKKGVFLLFVNGRLVVNPMMKESLFKIYKDLQRYPLIYVELKIERNDVDINVHPNKKEVMFNNEDIITRRICECIENGIRTNECVQKPMKILSRDSPRDAQYNLIKVYPDPTTQSIDECLEENERVIGRQFMLESLERMRSSVLDIDTEFFRSLNYVGVKDENTILVQHHSSLLNCKTRPLLKEYFYQSIIRDFGNFERKNTSIPCNVVNENLKMMLNDYFSMEIDGGNIIGLPVISGVCIDDNESWSEFNIDIGNEYDTLRNITDWLSTCYSKSVMSLKLFNILKRRIIGSEEALRCFGLVVTLKELYKNFERC